MLLYAGREDEITTNLFLCDTGVLVRTELVTIVDTRLLYSCCFESKYGGPNPIIENGRSVRIRGYSASRKRMPLDPTPLTIASSPPHSSLSPAGLLADPEREGTTLASLSKAGDECERLSLSQVETQGQSGYNLEVSTAVLLLVWA